MIKKYNSKCIINKKIAKKLYEILIKNLFILYPSFLKDKDKYDNIKNFNNWYDVITKTKNYNILTYEIDGMIIGFFNYCIIDKKLWISEVQINSDFRNKGFLKEFIKEFIKINKDSCYVDVYLHINSNNILSKKVFSHIGFTKKKESIYSIKLFDLIGWVNN